MVAGDNGTTIKVRLFNENNTDNIETSQTETTVVKEEITEGEIINRPVFRTRVSGDNPMSTEEEGAKLRGTGEAGNKKTVKRKTQTD